jgi:hypothetical protein
MGVTTSGAAHGKYWTNRDLQTVHVGEEYEPGQHRKVQIPDPSAMTEVLEAANAMTSYGVLRFADYSGVNIQSFVDEAVAWLAQNIPVRDETFREEKDRLRTLMDRRSQAPQEP